METPDIEERRVKCEAADSLNHAGSKDREGNDKMHSLDTIINHAAKLKLEARLGENKKSNPGFYSLVLSKCLEKSVSPKTDIHITASLVRPSECQDQKLDNLILRIKDFTCYRSKLSQCLSCYRSKASQCLSCYRSKISQ